MMITECAVMGPFVTEKSTVGPYTVGGADDFLDRA